MKSILKQAIAIAAVSGLAYAGSCSSNFCSKVKVDRIFVTDVGKILVKPVESTNALGCTVAAGGYLTIPPTSAAAKSTYAMLLTAHVTQAPVSIKVNTPSTGCTIKYVYAN